MSLRVAAVQHDIVWEDPETNFQKLRPQIKDAADNGAQLVVLSEMFSTGFTMNSAKCAEALDGASHKFLLDQATEYQIWIELASFVGIDTQSFYSFDRSVI